MTGGDGDTRRRSWSERWADPGFAPHWRSDAMDEPIRRAVEDGFFAHGASVLDIGCGSGEVAAFLARRGLRATGIDHVEPAIERALARFGEREGLAFRVADFCTGGGDIGRFDAALDRGCLHALPLASKPDYALTLTDILPPGGPFLLLHKTQRTDPAGDRMDVGDVRTGIERLFADAFETLCIEEMAFGRDARPMPGLAFRMRRRQPPAQALQQRNDRVRSGALNPEHQIDSEHALEDVVDEAIESAHGHEEISLADLLEDFGTRSFGPILVIVSLVIISPVGSVPGLPIALGALVVLFAVQIAFGRDHPWIPDRMRRIGFSRQKAEEARDQWHDRLEKIDRFIKPRMEWATGVWAEWLAAFCLVFLSATMIPLELIPFGVTIPGFAMLFFGIGFTARDGLFMLLGFLVTIPSIVVTILWWPFGGGG